MTPQEFETLAQPYPITITLSDKERKRINTDSGNGDAGQTLPPAHNSAASLVAAIEGNLAGMAHSDLVLTCKMLEGGRAKWRKEAEALQATLVMLKRELDPHISDPTKYELPRSAWDEAVRRHGDKPPTATVERKGNDEIQSKA